MNSKTKGSISESYVALSLMKKGYIICLPYGENCPYDLILDMRDGKLKRVQIKTGRIRKGSVIFNLSSCYYDATAGKQILHKYDKNKCDMVAVYCPENDKVYLLDNDKIKSGRQCNLRIEPLKDYRNLSRIIWAKDCEI